MTARSATSYRVIIVALGVPLVVTAIGLVLVSLWAPELPSTVATHWGFDGVDGVGPLWSIPILLLVVGVGVPGILYRAGRRQTNAWDPSHVFLWSP